MYLFYLNQLQHYITVTANTTSTTIAAAAAAVAIVITPQHITTSPYALKCKSGFSFSLSQAPHSNIFPFHHFSFSFSSSRIFCIIYFVLYNFFHILWCTINGAALVVYNCVVLTRLRIFYIYRRAWWHQYTRTLSNKRRKNRKK